MRSSAELTAEAERIMRLLKSEFRLPSGALGLERSEGVLFPHHIFPDLGDYLPFFLYFGDDQFADEQVDLYEKTLKKGYLVSEFKSFGVPGLVKSYEYTDLILGLADYHAHRTTDRSRDLYKGALDAAIRAFRLAGKPSSFYHPRLHVHLPVFDTRDGTFIEILVEAADALGDERYLRVAENLYERLIALPFYMEHDLVPTFHAPPYIRHALRNDKRFDSATICKNNTNTLFGFLALWKRTRRADVRESMEGMLAEIASKAMFEGGVAETFDPDNAPTSALLTASFPVVDFICDHAYATGTSTWLPLAERIANYWVGLRGATGLFPHRSGCRETFFDSETDMTIALRKLAEITGERRYRDAADACFEGVMRYHAPADYPLAVDIETGEVTNSAQRTKFLALFLKLLIATIREADLGESPLRTPSLTSLLKDR